MRNPLDPHAPVIPEQPQPNGKPLKHVECSLPAIPSRFSGQKQLFFYVCIASLIVWVLNAATIRQSTPVDFIVVGLAASVTLYQYYKDFWIPLSIAGLASFATTWDLLLVIVPLQIVVRLGVALGKLDLWHATATPMSLTRRSYYRERFGPEASMAGLSQIFPTVVGALLFFAPRVGVNAGLSWLVAVLFYALIPLLVVFGLVCWLPVRRAAGRAWNLWLGSTQPNRPGLLREPGPGSEMRVVLCLLACAAVAVALSTPMRDAALKDAPERKPVAEATFPDPNDPAHWGGSGEHVRQQEARWMLSVLIPLGLIALILPGVITFLGIVATAKWTLVAADRAIKEVKSLLEHQRRENIEEQIDAAAPPGTSWQQRQMLLGIRTRDRLPDILPFSTFGLVSAYFGAQNTGKTSSLITLILRAMQLGLSVVFVDLKGGDGEVLAAIRWMAQLLGIRLKIFSANHREASHLMNPFRMDFWKSFSLEERVAFLLAVCGAEHDLTGDKAFYAGASQFNVRSLLGEGYNIASFGQLAQELEHSLLGRQDDGLKHLRQGGTGVLAGLKRQESMLALNAHSTEQVSQAALDGAIDFGDLFTRQMALHVNLPASRGSSLAGEIGRLVLRGICAAAENVPAAHRRQTLLVVDEFVVVASPTIAYVLNQARSLSLGVCISSQSPGQIADPTLYRTILNHVALRKWFSVGPTDLKLLEEWSGTREAYRMNVSFSHTPQGTTMTEHYVHALLPFLSVSEIRRVSAHPRLFIWELTQDAGEAHTRGEMQIAESMHSCSLAEHERRKNSSWPTPEDDPSLILEQPSEPDEENGRPPLPLN